MYSQVHLTQKSVDANQKYRQKLRKRGIKQVQWPPPSSFPFIFPWNPKQRSIVRLKNLEKNWRKKTENQKPRLGLDCKGESASRFTLKTNEAVTSEHQPFTNQCVCTSGSARTVNPGLRPKMCH